MSADASPGRRCSPLPLERPRAWLILLLLACGLLVAGCDGRSYRQGHEDGFAAGFSKGHAEGREEGYRDGYRQGYSQGYHTVRPAGPELSEGEGKLVKFGSFLGGMGLLFGLGYCAFKVVAADISRDVAAAKAGAMAVAVLLATIAILIGFHRIADPLLLAARPQSRLLTGLVMLLAAGLTFVAAAYLRWVRKERWTRQQQILIASVFAFGICLLVAVEVAVTKAPGAERYCFSYFSLGALLGMAGHMAFRLTRKADGW